jgi:hypothetical protein
MCVSLALADAGVQMYDIVAACSVVRSSALYLLPSALIFLFRCLLLRFLSVLYSARLNWMTNARWIPPVPKKKAIRTSSLLALALTG